MISQEAKIKIVKAYVFDLQNYHKTALQVIYDINNYQDYCNWIATDECSELIQIFEKMKAFY